MITPNLRAGIPARFSILGLFLLFLLPTFSFQPSLLLAQKSRDREKPYALIFGTVWGPDDRPVYGVTVKIRKATDKKPKWEVFSDHHGEFAQR